MNKLGRFVSTASQKNALSSKSADGAECQLFEAVRLKG